MTPRLRPSFAQAIGGKWLTYAPPYAWLLPLWLSGSLLSTKNLTSWSDFVSITLINALALALTCVVFLILRQTLWRTSLRRTGITPLPLIVLGGLLLGITKAGVTVVGSAMWLSADSSELLGKLVASCALAVIVVLIVPVAMSELERYRTQRTELINRIVSSELSSASTHPPTPDSDLSSFLEHSLDALEQARSAPATLPQILDDLRENQVRPLSHQIWQREQQQIPDFTLVNLISVSLTKVQFVALGVVLGFVLLMGPSQLEQYGVVSGFLALILQSAIIGIGLTLANLIAPTGLAKGILFFVTTNLVLTALIAVSTTALFGPIPAFLPAQAALAVLQVLATLTLFTSVYRLTQKTHKAIEQDLLRLAPNIAEVEVKNVRQARANRELAQLLHSQVQNVLLAKQLNLEQARTQRNLTPTELRRVTLDVVDDLERYLRELTLPPRANNTGSFDSMIELVLATWSPVIDIHYVPPVARECDLFSTHPETLCEVVNEALSNAVRHGLARAARVEIHCRANEVTLLISDDGVGPRMGVPGLGTSLFQSLPGVTWSLTPGVDSHGSLLTLSITSA